MQPTFSGAALYFCLHYVAAYVFGYFRIPLATLNNILTRRDEDANNISSLMFFMALYDK
jgi:hypothetical protein